MNKVGKYAQGGVVQRFAAGTSGTGAKPKGDVLFDTIALRGLSGLEKSITKFIFNLDSVSFGSFNKLGTALDFVASKARGVPTILDKFQRATVLLNSVLPDFTNTIQTNSTANKRSKAKHMELVGAMADHIDHLLKNNATQQQVRQVAQKYVNQLNQNTSLMKGGATLPQLAGSSASPAAATVQAANPFATMTGTMGRASGGGGLPQNTNAVNANTKAQQGAARSAVEVVSNNKMFAASMATSLIAGFLPAVDENSVLC
jgi:hypothetical protein